RGWWGGGRVGGGERRRRRTRSGSHPPRPPPPRRWPHQGSVAAVSRSHFDANTGAFLASLGSPVTLASGSAIKFCHVAEGDADVYPRLATTCEWDVAAGQALIVAAGG